MKEVRGGILCKGCIAQRLKAVESENRAVVEDRQATIGHAKKRLRTSKIVFVVFFLFGVFIGLRMLFEAMNSKAPNSPGFFSVLVGGLLGSVVAGYYAWSFYWGVPAVWRFVRRMFQGMGCFLVLNPITWLIVLVVFLMILAFVGEFYCIFGGGWSQYRKCLKTARGQA